MSETSQPQKAGGIRNLSTLYTDSDGLRLTGEIFLLRRMGKDRIISERLEKSKWEKLSQKSSKR